MVTLTEAVAPFSVAAFTSTPPGASAVRRPPALMVATRLLDDDQVTWDVTSTGAPLAPIVVAIICFV